MGKGKIIVLSGASSVGKGKIRDALMENQDLHLFYSISVTTRPRKEDEVDGKDYYFVNHKSFAQAVRNQEFLEYTEFNGYYYGTPNQWVEFMIDMGKNVLIEVEAQGVGQIRMKLPECISVFVVPESMEELERQIRKRYKDDEAGIKVRVSKASMEMELASLFDLSVNNTEVDESVAKIVAYIQKEMEDRK